MDMIELRRRVMLSMGGKIPSFMNQFEYGSFMLTDSTKTSYDIILKNDYPNCMKGILIYSNEFDIDSPKADKPMLGAYAAVYIMGANGAVYNEQYAAYQSIYMESTYAVNWGQDTDGKSPVWRSSRTETRGISFYRPSTKTLEIIGFGTGEYDFKRNVEYHYLVWD